MQQSTLAAIERAATTAAAGDTPAAVALLQEELEQAGDARALVHHILARLQGSAGEVDAALANYAMAQVLGGLTADLAFDRAELSRRAGAVAQAAEDYDRALSLQPGHVGARNGRLVVLIALQRYEAALADGEALLAACGPSAQLHNNLGIVLKELGRWEAALASYDAALSLAPDHALAHHNRGVVLAELKRNDEAIEAFTCAAALRPDLAESWTRRGALLAEAERFDEALADFDRAIAARGPGYFEAQNNRSIALRRLYRFHEALAAAQAALAARPDWSPGLNSLGAALFALHRYEAALSTYEALIAREPEHAPFWLNRGMTLEALGRLEEAMASMARARTLAPDLADATFNAAHVHLRAGDFETGFKLYEARWRGVPPRYAQDETLWTGEQPVAGRTLLVHAEQGFGDTIQFCRFLAGARALGAEVVFEVHPPLKSLMQACAGWDRLIAAGESTPTYDLQVPVMSLPRALGVRLETLPRAPYLAAPADRAMLWRERLPPARHLRVGLAWSGNPGHQNDHNRSIAFEALAPLFAAPVEFVSLQREHRMADRSAMARASLRIFEDELHDFADTAALAATCDLVIAVDTAVAHLAGAMGLPLWLLLAQPNDWRWMQDRQDTPWYPTARLFRQPAPNDWPALIEQVAEALVREAPVAALAG